MLGPEEKKIWFAKSFNEQMSWLGEEVESIIKNDFKKKIKEKGRAAYGEPGCAYAVKKILDIIKSDPKNRPLLREICRAEQELIAFLYDEPNALSAPDISIYYENFLISYIAELQQSPSLYYLLVKTPESGGRGEVLGVYRSAGILRTAYDKAVRELEAEQKDSGTHKKITINSFDEQSNAWQYDIAPEELFGAEQNERGRSGVIAECIMDSPYMWQWKLENVVKDLYGYTYNDTLARALRPDESILVRFDVEHTYEVLDKFAWYWGSWNSCPSWETMRDISKKWHEKYGAELIMIAHDALKFQCRRLTEEEASEIIAEANSLTAEVINGEHELNKNLSGKSEFTLWWD